MSGSECRRGRSAPPSVQGAGAAAWSNGKWRREIGVSVATYRGWETNRTAPALIHVPAAIAFLGYDWRESDGTLGGRLRLARTAHGLTIRELAAHLGVDPSTLRDWEANVHVPSDRHRAEVNKWLATIQET